MIDVQTPAFRRTDPHTSELAAASHTASGARASQQRAAAAAVARFPGRTSRELSVLAGLDRHELARRLPECEVGRAVFKGGARSCRESGRLAITWWPVPQQGELAP
jgi:hypothetical protein